MLNAIRQLQPHLPLYGQAQCDWAYSLLGESDAPKRVQVLLEESLRQQSAAPPIISEAFAPNGR